MYECQLVMVLMLRFGGMVVGRTVGGTGVDVISVGTAVTATSAGLQAASKKTSNNRPSKQKDFW